MANSTYILGINGGVRPGYQDISAVLMKGGKVVAAVEEERLNRIKFSAGQLPVASIKQVLQVEGITIEDVALVGFHGSTWGHEIEGVLENHFHSYFNYCPPIKRYHHHACHAASTYYASGYKDALVITVDGSGDGVSTRISVGRDGKLEVLKDFQRPQSLGIFYSMITQLCGFVRDSDEYKLMGLAAYGNAERYNLDNVLQLTEEGYFFNTEYLVEIKPGQPSPSRHEMLYSKKLTEELGLKRRYGKEIAQEYKDLAACAQLKLEEALMHIVKVWISKTGISNVCMAGGVALNCLANRRIEGLAEVKELFIQPASSDAGISLGAAFLASAEVLGGITPVKQRDTFLGNSFNEEEIEQTLINCNIIYTRTNDVVAAAASALAKGLVIGWFQERMEFGPRALGSRSILANAAVNGIKDTVNRKIKFREGYRPFGASVLEEDFGKYFVAKCADAPFMTKVFDVQGEYRELLAGVTHADNTCRVQTVNRLQHGRYYDLLSKFKEETGISVLLNTSFNLSHEPIVNTPREAIASFYASGMDELYLGNFIVRKKDN